MMSSWPIWWMSQHEFHVHKKWTLKCPKADNSDSFVSHSESSKEKKSKRFFLLTFYDFRLKFWKQSSYFDPLMFFWTKILCYSMFSMISKDFEILCFESPDNLIFFSVFLKRVLLFFKPPLTFDIIISKRMLFTYKKKTNVMRMCVDRFLLSDESSMSFCIQQLTRI